MEGSFDYQQHVPFIIPQDTELCSIQATSRWFLPSEVYYALLLLLFLLLLFLQ